MKTVILFAILLLSSQLVVAQSKTNTTLLETQVEIHESDLVLMRDTTVSETPVISASQGSSHESQVSEKEKRAARIVGGVLVFFGGSFAGAVYLLNQALKEINKQVTEGINGMNG